MVFPDVSNVVRTLDDGVIKVLYISYDGMTDPLGQSQVLPYLKGLALNDYEIHLVSFEKTDRYRQQKKYIQQICMEVGITWHPQDYHNEGGLRKTLLQVSKMKKVSQYLHEKHHFQIVHCRSYIAALAGLMLKRKHGIRFIFDMRGFWADERVDGELWNLKNPLYRAIYSYFKRMERIFLKSADYTVSLTHKAKEELLSRGIDGIAPIEVIPCCVDLDLFNPQSVHRPKKEVREELQIRESQFVLGYIGSIGTWYMLNEMLLYFKNLLLSRPDSLFLFISKEEPELIYRAAETLGISKDKIMIRSAMHHEVPQFVNCFDASIFFIKASYSKMASSPTKQGELMAMGIPVICNSGVGDTDQIIHKYHSGYVVNNPHDITEQDVTIDLAQYDPIAIREGASDYFSLDNGVKSYLKIYKQISA